MVPEPGEIRHFVVDGVPCWHAAGPGRTQAVLLFRVGHADEPLPVRGISHLVEHLALHAVSQEHRDSNGAVGHTLTSFVALGTPEEVGTFLTRVTAALRELPLDRLAHESRVLETEAARRGPSAYGTLLTYRYGPQGYGVLAYDELGLDWLDGQTVQRWAKQWFTADNAAMWIYGPLPPDLRLALLPGVRIPPPEPSAAQVALPGVFWDRPGVVAIDVVAPRSDALAVGMYLARERVERRLRHEEGVTYGVGSDLVHWTATTSHGYLAADALPENASAVANGVVATTAQLGTSAPAPEELQGFVAGATQAWDRVEAIPGVLDALATAELEGRRSREVPEYLADLAALTPEEVAEAIRVAVRTALVLLPPTAALDDRRFEPVAQWSSDVVEGTALVRSVAIDQEAAAQRLVVCPEGASHVVGDGRFVTVRFAEVVAVRRWEDGARTLIARDGFQLFIHPGEWANGAWAVEVVDWAIDDERVAVVRRPAGSRYLDEVEAQRAKLPPAPPPPPAPSSRWRRR